MKDEELTELQNEWLRGNLREHSSTRAVCFLVLQMTFYQLHILCNVE